MIQKKKSNFSSWDFIWAIIDTFVNILTMIAVVILLSSRIRGWLLVFMILVFILWAFRPMYLAFKDSLRNFPKKTKKPNNFKLNFPINFLCYYILFLLSIIIFILLVLILGKAVHPIIIASSIIISSGILTSYHLITKNKINGPLSFFSRFFFLTSIVLLIFVLAFSVYGLEKAVNLNRQKIIFDVYIVNDVVSGEKALEYVNYSNNVWNKYNISVYVDKANNVYTNLTTEEVKFLYENGNNEKECLNYSKLISRITDNSTNLSIVFLASNKSYHTGRGCLCNCTFILVSQEKLLFKDFTGWDVAHEIGHILGLGDIKDYGRVKRNLMNDEYKKLFINSDYLSQSQLDIAVKKLET